MKLLVIERSDVVAVKQLVKQQAQARMVRRRIANNVSGPVPHVRRADLWEAVVLGLLTTQNRAGKGSRVSIILDSGQLALKLCQTTDGSVQNYVRSILKTPGLQIRRWKIISGMADYNFRTLEKGEWENLVAWRQRLIQQRKTDPDESHYQLEREAARYLQNHDLFQGLGPKQSRNFWQHLGLTRYEIPLDSRVLRWFKSALRLDLPSQALAKEVFYVQVLNTLRKLCLEAGVLPCVLDAAIFSLYERENKRSSIISL